MIGKTRNDDKREKKKTYTFFCQRSPFLETQRPPTGQAAFFEAKEDSQPDNLKRGRRGHVEGSCLDLFCVGFPFV